MAMFNNSSCVENCTEYRCGVPPVIPASLGIPESISLIQGVIAVLCALVGLPMNLYLLVIIIKFKSLHQRSLLLMLQMIAVEILYLVVIPGPVIFTSAVSGKRLFGEAMCNIIAMIHDLFPIVRFYFTLALTIDRFVLTFWPFFYSKYEKIVPCSLMGAMWFAVSTRIILPVYGLLDCYTFSPYLKTCTLSLLCSPSCKIFATLYGLLWSTTILLAIIVYFIIIVKMRMVARRCSAASLQNTADVSRNAQYLYFQMHKSKNTLLILLMSVAIATPPIAFYLVTNFVFKEPNATVLIGNIAVVQTFFNLIPVFDALSLAMHKDIRKVSHKILQSFLTR